ncbi:origin recognition complex subunit 6-like isoform X2 [Pomacea canaliculata]|uniref:origin recognition complex subunit 6-like isoform X2 n=1 Tax=Pomacea canaliculata TaxID=400727 RepID=UPI000D73A125|nr:origin recognition complex subunit 6-like isoform X2 [Pomacea canaliculata]
MAESGMYRNLGKKIGIMNDKTLLKAAELKSLLNVRGGTMSVAALRLTDTAVILLCLDMAATYLSQPFDKVQSIKLSGLKKSAYLTSLKTLESILDLCPKTSMRDMAVQFGCLEALDLASKVLDRYQQVQCCDVETNTTLFRAASLISACRYLKVRIDQVRLKEISGVKRSTMDKLLTQMGKIVLTMQEETNQRSPTLKRSLLEVVEDAVNDAIDMPSPKCRKTEKDLNYYKQVDFDQWKANLLNKAGSSNICLT